MVPRVDVTRVLADRPELTSSEAEAVLEIAYLSTAVEGQLSDSELDAFATLAARLRREPIEGKKLDVLLEGYARHIEHRHVAERLAEVARSLSRNDARRVAYKAVFAMALCDLTSPEEAFDDALLGVLGLSVDDADALESEVYAMLDDVQ
jgi:hypothetical protein